MIEPTIEVTPTSFEVRVDGALIGHVAYVRSERPGLEGWNSADTDGKVLWLSLRRGRAVRFPTSQAAVDALLRWAGCGAMIGPTIDVTPTSFEVGVDGVLFGHVSHFRSLPDGHLTWEAFAVDDGGLVWSSVPVTVAIGLPTSQAAVEALLERAGVVR